MDGRDGRAAVRFCCALMKCATRRLLAFSLTSRKLNAARGNRRLLTSVVSLARSPTLIAWATALKFPSPFPHWARLRRLQKAERNDRIVRVDGPPNASGRQPVMVDAHISYYRRLPRTPDAVGRGVLIRSESIEVTAKLFQNIKVLRSRKTNDNQHGKEHAEP